MKKNKVFSFISLLSLLSLADGLYAGAGVAPKTPVCVVVDLQVVATKSSAFAKIQKTVEAAVQKMVDEIKALEQKFNKIVEKLQSGSKDMTVEAQNKLQEELASLKAQMDVKQRNLQSYVENEGRKAEMQLIKNIQDECRKKGYDIVIPAAIFVKPEFDRTNEIIEAMDKNSGSAMSTLPSKLAPTAAPKAIPTK